MAKRRNRFAFASLARFSCFGGQARVKKMTEVDGYPVKLHIYDLSQGMARQLSATILGKAIEGIWHTGVVVYGREYYFGGGIQQGQPGQTPYGTPVRVEDLGMTHVPREVFEDFLREIGPRYTPATYSLLTHNCNNFSNEAVQFLASTAVPSYILQLPNEVMSSPIGALIMPMIQGLETSLRAGAVPQQPQFRPAATATVKQPSTNRVEARSTAADKPEAPATKEVEAGSAAAEKPEAGETAGSGDGNDGSPAVPPAVQPAAAAAPVMVVAKEAAAPPADKPEALAAKDVEAGSAAANKLEAGETASNDADNDGSTTVPPAVQPATPPTAAAQVSAAAPAVVVAKEAAAPPDDKPEALATKGVQAGSAAADKPEAGETDADNDGSPAFPPAVQPTAPLAAAAQVSAAAAAVATKAAAPPEDPLAEAKSLAQEEIRREFAAIMAAGTSQAGEAAALAMRRVMERHGLQRAVAQRG
ncbi:unnamed protein product [Urochloa decumbens]|uniref:PPPDE domain-containing protein n=1 Tax=Urochloa decumbens TaxID=240449 RepID=A0ABC8X172_9POAL